jgi:DNA-binding IclR family transcriptional regulator
MDTIAHAGDGASRNARVPGGRPAGPAQSGVGVLDRSVTLLELLADGPRSLRWLSDHSRLPRPTAHRLLVALEAHGLVGRDGSGAFRLGPRLAELAFRADPTLNLATLADPVLARLHDATGESVQLYVRSGDKRLCIAARDSGTGLRDSVPVGAVLPLAAGSGGKVLLAWAADASRFDGVPGSELAAIRDRGWAATVAEREQGLASVSAPVLRPDGTVAAAVCVSGPVTRLGQSPGRRLSAAVIGAASELAAELAAGTSTR